VSKALLRMRRARLRCSEGFGVDMAKCDEKVTTVGPASRGGQLTLQRFHALVLERKFDVAPARFPVTS
jgi:hypothetical protein